MVKDSNKNHLNRRRGISTIVGGIIFVVLLTAGFSTFFVAMDVQSDTINAQRTISNSIIDKTQEKFSIAAATDDSTPWPTLGLQVKNEGPNPIQISNIWIINKSMPDQPAKNIPIEYSDAFIPPGYGLSILENQPLKMIDPTLTPGFPDLYDIKVVSALGTIKQTELNVGGNNYLLAEMFTIPPDVRLNENVTVAMRITNVGPTIITGVAPNALLADDVPLPHAWINGIPELVSQSPVVLKPSESTIFSWHSKLNNAGTIGGKIKFSSSATGTESLTGFTVNSNTASDKLTVRDPKGGNGEEIVLKDELFAQPGIFMVTPNNFGDNGEQGIWGITIANPTDAPMDVSKITTSVLFAGANDNQKILDVGCPHTNVPPTLDFWDCPNQNQLVWYDGVGPIYSIQTVNPRSAFSFLVTVQPGSIQGASGGLDSVVLHSSVFTSLGAFGETRWTTSMADGSEAIVNAYVSTVVDSTNPNNVEASRIGIPSGSSQRFNVVLADLDTSVTDYIRQGAQLIINIPKEWTLTDAFVGNTGFVDPVTVNTFPDGSSQIVGTLLNDLTTGGKTITFDASAPSPSCDKMYVMHILANGRTGGDRPIGPVAETVLQVNPTGACP